ncbi:SURF1 family protein [Neorhizobium sp. JUb45]|uniref:SURF1 family protein n=1 Tax=unclassified Neorhizobium TaxID=2629175 RepID=UPI00104BA8E1|nr:SURF1 family protein [Neorhizobium sp. JUb45]TCR04267.1 surfeit locus 1 family protein [Neorhizobium sp. JUb45]
MNLPASCSRTILTAALVLAALAILLSLGTWQVERLHWKEGLIAKIAERRDAAPVPLAEIEAAEKSGADFEFRRVAVSGTFDHAKERHFFATHQGQTGFYVYTPMLLDDGRTLLVNRGFVPYEMKDAAKRQQGQVAGVVALTGYARAKLTEKPSSLVPDNDLPKNIFYWKDIVAMTSSAGLDPAGVLPFFVDVDATVKNPGGFPVGGVTQFDLPNNHLQYAVTWYGLALALAGVVFAMWLKRRRTPA